ncbi:MAG TPA: hypothetical protein VME22_30375 [Solirubrobacteraceae bacterium]|nr:hypothetical protein [Solirubrobacteraceae bacterium]
MVASATVLCAAALAFTPSALASVSPSLSLDQSAGTTAGAFQNLGVDLKFAFTGADSPEDLTLDLPPGLLADASIDGGACLRSADLTDAACQVGSGTVVADADGTIPITTPVTFDLVPPPQPGDLAGLAVDSNGTQIGATADVKIRPSGDPLGVGIAIDFVLPNSLYGVPISIAEINSTFDGLRYPTTCPSAPQSFTVSVDSYSDPTVRTASAPLSVTGCSALSYAPAFDFSATRDSGDSQVALTTQVTETASEAPSGSLTLVVPTPPVGASLSAVALACPSVSSSTCSPIGSVTASSPLYPSPLTGAAYLTGSGLSLSLTLVFPSPFPLTLSGPIDLNNDSTAFTGLPDLPLTSLRVALNGGPHGLFSTTCTPPSGTATAILTDQNGDRTVHAASPFTISGCAYTSENGAGVRVTDTHASGLGAGHPSLRFKVQVAKGHPKLRTVTVALPSGPSFASHGIGRPGGIVVTGARIKTLGLSRGHLVITLRKAASGIVVSINAAALRESPWLERRIKQRRLHRLPLTVITQNTRGRRATIRAQITIPGQ